MAKKKTTKKTTKKATKKKTSTKAVKKSNKKKSNSAKSVADSLYDALNKWNVENERIMNGYNDYAYNLSQDYLDAQDRYASMASDAQKEANDYNAEQAQIQRDWSESMSATAHQREVADLEAAGLNPVISAYGSGNSVGSGAAASSSNSLTSAFGELASQALGAVASLANTMQTSATSYANAGLGYTTSIRQSDVQEYAAKLSSETNLAMNKATNQMNLNIAKLNNLNQKEIAKIAADANLSAADIHAAASRYGAQIAYASAVKTAAMNNQTSKEVADKQVNRTFEGMATSTLQKAGNWLSDFISGSGVYKTHNENQATVNNYM